MDGLEIILKCRVLLLVLLFPVPPLLKHWQKYIFLLDFFWQFYYVLRLIMYIHGFLMCSTVIALRLKQRKDKNKSVRRKKYVFVSPVFRKSGNILLARYVLLKGRGEYVGRSVYIWMWRITRRVVFRSSVVYIVGIDNRVFHPSQSPASRYLCTSYIPMYPPTYYYYIVEFMFNM